MAIQAVNQGITIGSKTSVVTQWIIRPLGSLACFFFQFGWPAQTDYDTLLKILSDQNENLYFWWLFNLWAALAAFILISYATTVQKYRLHLQ